MRTVKLTKKMMQSLGHMHKKLESTDGKDAFPQHLYVNTKTANMIKKELTKAFRKEHPYLRNSNKIAFSVGVQILNLGPVEISGNGLKDGYVLVDDIAIANEIKNKLSKGA